MHYNINIYKPKHTHTHVLTHVYVYVCVCVCVLCACVCCWCVCVYACACGHLNYTSSSQIQKFRELLSWTFQLNINLPQNTHKHMHKCTCTRVWVCMSVECICVCVSVCVCVLDVSFAEYSLFDRTLLQKRPIILNSLLIVATPYTTSEHSPLHWGGSMTFHPKLQSQSQISISLVSFQRNVAKETQRTRLSIEIRDWRNDTRIIIGCTFQSHELWGGYD